MPKVDYIEMAKALGQKQELPLPVEEQDLFAQIWDISSEYTSTFDSAKSFEKLSAAIKAPKRSNRNYIWVAAASVLLIIGVALFNLLPNKEASFATLKGEHKTILLDDQSEVQMQGGSELILDKQFNNETRSMHLEGVAFFDVAKNPEKPFIIHTKRGTVRVLGTSFTVHAEDETQRFAVDVYEGRVEVKNDQGAEVLTKGMHLEMDKDGQMKIGSTNGLLHYTIDQFVFVNSRVADIVKEIENKFGVDVNYDQSLANQKITLKTKAKTADQLLRILSGTLDSEFSTSKAP
jgi:ferric-dicitrate binding protein FerR (iron transport regulator)